MTRGFFWHDKHVQKLGGGDGYKTVRISKSHLIVYFKRMIILVYELYINEATFQIKFLKIVVSFFK